MFSIICAHGKQKTDCSPPLQKQFRNIPIELESLKWDFSKEYNLVKFSYQKPKFSNLNGIFYFSSNSCPI